MQKQEPTLCLNMIVKNESKIITRQFDSVVSLIDCYCISDTGSTDNTVEIIKDYFGSKNIPGKIVHEPFRNFAYNRNMALQSCLYMSDYILLLDADMILDIRQFKKSLLTSTSYFVLQGTEHFHYNNLRIIKNNGNYNYIGFTHEYLNIMDGSSIDVIPKMQLFIQDIGDGGSKTTKYERDIQLLLKGIEEEPQYTERYHFYLANSYFDLKQFEKAIDTYKKRLTMKGFEQEIWYSHYRIGICYYELGEIEKAICSWLDAYNFFPLRIENLYEIVKHYRTAKKYKIAMQFYHMARKTMKNIKDRDSYLFLSNDVYTFRLDFEYSIFACYVNIKNINSQIMNILNHCYDPLITNNVLYNMKFYKDIWSPLFIQHINLSNTIKYSIDGKMRDFHSSSSSILERKGYHQEKGQKQSRYIMNIRYVNYRITPQGNYLDCDDHIITINKYVELSSDFQVIKEHVIDVVFDKKRYIGIEDVRLFVMKDGHMIMTGTTLHKQTNQLGMVMGNYDLLHFQEENRLVCSEISASFAKTECEKNWVFVNCMDTNTNTKGITHDYIVYQWFPFTLCKLEQREGLSFIEKERVLEMPKIFQLARGSTNGTSFNKEIWFVVHLVSYESPREYYHMIVVFDICMNLLRYSAPFKFEGQPIEYCIGFIIQESRIIMTYSIWDGCTKIAVFDKKVVEERLVYNK